VLKKLLSKTKGYIVGEIKFSEPLINSFQQMVIKYRFALGEWNVVSIGFSLVTKLFVHH